MLKSVMYKRGREKGDRSPSNKPPWSTEIRGSRQKSQRLNPNLERDLEIRTKAIQEEICGGKKK